MIDAVFNLLFACRHRRLTRPITPVHRPGTPARETYAACLDCGARLPYDVANMRVAGPPARPQTGTPKRRRPADTAASDASQ
jgi:hypothetical protein